MNQIYERALKELPGSYKLWYSYLRTRREQLKSTCISNNQAFEDVNNSHERALVFMHKVFICYCLSFITHLIFFQSIIIVYKVFNSKINKTKNQTVITKYFVIVIFKI